MISSLGRSATSTAPSTPRGRPGSADWYMFSPDGRTIYFYGRSSPSFIAGNGFCTQWGPKVIQWPHPGKIVQISCGNLHGVFLTDDNRVYGTGSNPFGQLGDNYGNMEEVGVSFPELLVPTKDRIVDVEAGVYASCTVVRTETGDVYSCGDFRGRTHSETDPIWRMCLVDRAVFNHVPVRMVAPGGCVGTFLTEDGAVYIVGLPENGEIKGITGGVFPEQGYFIQTPMRLTSLWDEGVRVTMVSSGHWHTIAVGTSVTTGEQVVYGWGSNFSGQLGEDFRTQPDVLQPTLLRNVMAKLRDGDVVDKVVQVACGDYHSLLTLRSGRVLSLGAVGRYGQLGRSAAAASLVLTSLAVDCCQFMLLDRPVRAAYPGSHFSLLIPEASSALREVAEDEAPSEGLLDAWVFGTCGIGGTGALALYADDLELLSNHQCRLVTRFFSLREAIDSVARVPPIEEVVEPVVAAEVIADQGDDEDDAEDDTDDEEDDLVYLSVDFSGDVTSDDALQRTLRSLPKRLLPVLAQAWALPAPTDDTSAASIVAQAEQALQVRAAVAEAAVAAFADRARAQLAAGRLPRRLRAPRRRPPRYALLIANHYNLVDLRDLVALFSPTASDADAGADVDVDAQCVAQHVAQHLASLQFVSTSLYADSVDTAGELGALLRDRRVFPQFTTLSLEQTSLVDRAVNEAMAAAGDEQPGRQDAAFAALVTALLHHEEHRRHRADAACESGVTTLEFSSVGVGAQTLRAIATALASHPSPATSVGLRTLSCRGVGIDAANATAAYAAVRDVIALNVPSLRHVHLADQDETMAPAVAELLAPAVRQNTHLRQLWLSVSELGAEGVGLEGVQHLYEALRQHASPRQCVLYDVDVSGDDGQPSIYEDTGDVGDEAAEAGEARRPAINGRKLAKLWQALLRRNAQNHLQALQTERAEQRPEQPALAELQEAVAMYAQRQSQQQRKKRRGGGDGASVARAYVTAQEEKWVRYVASRPLDMSAERWEEEFEYQ